MLVIENSRGQDRAKRVDVTGHQTVLIADQFSVIQLWNDGQVTFGVLLIVLYTCVCVCVCHHKESLELGNKLGP